MLENEEIEESERSWSELKQKAEDLLEKAKIMNVLIEIRKEITSKLASTMGQGDWVNGYEVALEQILEYTDVKIKELKGT